jgi:hypothetical protein
MGNFREIAVSYAKAQDPTLQESSMAEYCLRAMEPRDRNEVAELICVSTNYWYQKNRGTPIFSRGPEATEIFFDVYQALDPGCGVVAENPRNGRLMGSCFYHPREHHVSLGIMNVHPNYFGRGVARALNLDSFSLYTRAGFVPRCAYQDMVLRVPETGLAIGVPGQGGVRPATLDDVPALVDLELEISGICREKDYRYFIENRDGIWGAAVCADPRGRIDGFMFSSRHPGSSMIGPGVARTAAQAAALVRAALDRYRGGAAVFLVPVECQELVQQMYAWGAKNCEIHFCQVRGQFQPPRGVTMPVFLPESG